MKVWWESNLIRNKEFQSIVVKTLLLVVMLSIIFILFIDYSIDKINHAIVEQHQAFVGSLLIKYPEMERDVIPYITQEVRDDAIRVGEEILKKYGYTKEMEVLHQPLLENRKLSFQITIMGLMAFFMVFLFLVIYKEYDKIYEKLREVSRAAERVVEGNFDVYLRDEGEGEFSILNHHFNQMANRLKNSLDNLKKEKIFLKNTISDISHQLKTPLSSLIMLNDLMLEDNDMEDSIRVTFLERSKIQLERMEWLIINLLKLARIEAGAIAFKKERVTLKEVTASAIEALGPKYPVENIVIDVTKNIEGVFYGDQEWTTEALINLLKNAMEHNDKENPIEIKIEETPLFSSITIRDYGEGIDEKDLPNIFKRFYKGGTASKADSIGIGLNLSKLIIESQDGSISVKSKKGEGTTFTISFLKGINRLTK